jgi:hypothetical protein
MKESIAMAKHSLCAILISAILVAGCTGTTSTPIPAGATPSPATQGPASSAAGTTPGPSGLPVLQTVMEGPTVIDVPTDVVSTSVVTPAGAVIQADGVSVTVPAGGVASATTVVVTR